ncbi:MAG: recombinase family protein [Intrasporangium sp.]|uniref:helix-turn-helix domain-containing protein n=1 Tax=Intrasporangium sp. TaxID=1925024 RepID=UPI002647DF02|nr:recombinase family protein [Intrasporangium sp.]MDN5797373.1 recombinase family protein [Intrasporangium sp.]
MALIGLVRVSCDTVDASRQHALLDPLCDDVFEERANRRLVIDNRPGLRAALEALGPNDALAIEHVGILGPKHATSHIVLARLHDRGVRLRILTGYASSAPLHETVEYGRALDCSRRLVRRLSIQEGHGEARTRGALIGRPSVVDDAARQHIMMRRARGESLRAIATAIGVSRGTVANVAEARTAAPESLPTGL